MASCPNCGAAVIDQTAWSGGYVRLDAVPSVSGRWTIGDDGKGHGFAPRGVSRLQADEQVAYAVHVCPEVVPEVEE